MIDVANGRADKNRFVFSEYHGAGAAGAAFMVRQDRYKLIHYVGHAPELFDVEADPEERDNLAQKAEFAAVHERLDAMLRTVLDPDAADAKARADQAVLLERIGGIDAVLGRGSFAGTPAPGK